MRNSRRVDYPRTFKLNVLSVYMVEQPGAVSEQDGHEVNL